MQASIFGSLGLKVTDSRTIDYYRGDLDQKHFQDIYCGCFYCSGNTFLYMYVYKQHVIGEVTYLQLSDTCQVCFVHV